MSDATAVPPAWIPRLDASLLRIDSSPSTLLHQTSAVTIRRSRISQGASAPVALLSFRSCYPKRQQLWQATLRLLEHQVFRQPQHPNLVSVIGLADKSDQDEVGASHPESVLSHSALVVMELIPASLYDAIHVDKMRLSRSDILFIATTVLDILRFLHDSGRCFGSTLTSRKVMLGGLRDVKLRRFCAEWICREAEDVVDSVGTSSFSSQYVMPTTEAVAASLQRAQLSDLYAFGMLLLEMCTGDKPNPEICNSISQAGRVDSRLELIIHATLRIHSPDDLKSDDPGSLLGFCARLLSECNNCESSSLEDRRSCSSFESFLHADRYFLTHEESSVEKRVAERMAQSAVALKRLAAVEEDLVEEQRNFEVIVKQLEQLRLDKAADESRLDDLNRVLSRLHNEMLDQSNTIEGLRVEAAKSQARVDEITQELHESEDQLRRAHAHHVVLEDERQSLVLEIVRLKDEKRASTEERHDLERQLAETAAKVGGEKDAILELEVRYRQAAHRCEQEQKNRRNFEKQLEALSRQLTEMEEERSRYCGALQMAPTGHLDVRSSKHLVLELKEKEVQSLRDHLQALNSTLADTQKKLECSESERHRLDAVVCPGMQERIDVLQTEVDQFTTTLAELSSECDSLHQRIDESKTFAEELQSTILTLEEQVVELQKQVADADKARRLRQCLTPNCDAPRYLVKPSGFCVDCEEEMSKERAKTRGSVSSVSRSSSREHGGRGHRRQRSLDGATAILNNTKNASLMDLLKRIEVARDFDDESREESSLDLIAIMKQLGRLLKDSATLKEDLPECGVLRCILSVMEQCLNSAVVVIECCKTLSVAVFNHDRNRLILVAEGVVELVLRMLREFSRETKVLEAGAVLLTNLSHNSESNRQRILAAGGVDAVLGMMESFPRDAGIQKKSCWALLTLAGSDFMCDKIAELGGVGATLAAMLNCPDDEDVQHYGSWTLLNLVSGTKHVQQFARQEGVVEVTEAAVACFPDHPGIQAKCRDILDLIRQSDDTSS